MKICENPLHIDTIHMLCLHEGFRFSSKDLQSVSWSWFVDFSDYALVFLYLCNSIFSTFVGVIYTWGEVIYAPLIGVCVTPTVYSMYETKHACITECRLYLQGALLSTWRSADQRRAEDPNHVNFTLDHVYHVAEFFSAKWYASLPHLGIA